MKNKTKHSPGEWRVTHLRRGIDHVNVFRIGSGEAGEIARTTNEQSPHAEADARLMAEAPKMYKALKFCLTRNGVDGDARLVKRIKAILAKVEGK